MSALQWKRWWEPPTMQQYLFSSLWSRPGDRFADMLTRTVIKSPPMARFAAASGLLFELAAPLALLDARAARLFGCVAFAFHVGVFQMQGISFLSYWSPALLMFLVDPAPLEWSTLLPPQDAGAAALWCWRIAAGHCACQLFVAFSFLEAYTSGMLPFTCMPVFAVSTNLFDPTIPHSFVMTGGEVRCAGHMGDVEWKGPQFQDPWFQLTHREVEALPFPAMWLVVGKAVSSKTLIRRTHSGQVKLVAEHLPTRGLKRKLRNTMENTLNNLALPKYAESGFALFANFEVPEELLDRVRLVTRILLCGCASDAYDRCKLEELVEAQRTCRELFDRVVQTKQLPASPVLFERGISLLR
ncbi:hypothetical protein CYMTET_48438 [Cymbomonas tetramitiformis]|uniref:Uncharacterized protein n=1 Tax=Cymbomonas tetramitiformis TaxID=36881 RepID=A0AAE0BTZ7_9CHLO|nr:hypothetical protein CYMTET_48438 [Cymbomonas tetramitiformis]